MNWFLIDKSQTAQPATGTYKQWKSILRAEGKYQCVYCCISEGMFGGERNFHVEHYRPQKHFAALANVIANLFYSCAICNSFKGSDWPRDPANDFSDEAYPDPSAVDYADFLSVDISGAVQSSFVAGKYVIERLNLNRSQLLLVRKLIDVLREIQTLTGKIEAAAESCIDVQSMQDGIASMSAAIALLAKLPTVVPYENADARR